MRFELVISKNQLNKLTQKDIVSYAEYLRWEEDENSPLLNGTIVLNSPEEDDNLVQLLVCSEKMIDKIFRYADCIKQLSEYYSFPYIQTYEKIIGFKHHPDCGDKIRAVCSWGEGVGDVMMVCQWYGITKYFDLSACNANRLGMELIKAASESEKFRY